MNEHEKRVVCAYRERPEVQPAIDTMLGIETAPAQNRGCEYVQNRYTKESFNGKVQFTFKVNSVVYCVLIYF